MSLVSYQLEGKAAIITLKNGKVNAFSLQLIADLDAALTQAEEDCAVVVLTGQPGIFSAGFDLPSMMESAEKRANVAQAGLKMVRRIMSFPTPIIVACSGHALALGGVILASGDYRIGVKGDFKIGFNEVQIGIAFTSASLLIIREQLAKSHLTRCALLAEIQSPKGALEAGILDNLVEPDELLALAIEQAEHYARTLDMKAFALSKLAMRDKFLTDLDNRIDADRDGIVSAF